MNTTSTDLYTQAANMIYAKTFTDRFLGYLFSSKRSVALTFVRKYNDKVMRHEDVTEFIVGKLPSLVVSEPELFSSHIWEDETSLHSDVRARLFTIFLNYTINRWHKYMTINHYESGCTDEQWELLMKIKPDTKTSNVETKLSNAIAYRKVWLDYTNTLETIDRVIAMYLLDGCITFEELKADTGLKKTAIYARIERIKRELAGLTAEL